MGDRFETLSDGQWCELHRRGQKLACCDCGLTHVYDFRIVRRGSRQVLMMRARRLPRSTAAVRRGFKFTRKRAE